MKLFLLFLAILPFTATAAGLENYPGWSIAKIQTESEEGTYDHRVFYSLTPPDGRPAITIDGRSASQLQSGSTSPEAIYSRQVNANKEGSNAEEEYVYSSSNSKIIVADGPSEETKVEEVKEPEVREEKSFAPLQTATLPPVATESPKPVAAASTGNAVSSPKVPAAQETSSTNESSEAQAAPKPMPVRPGLPEPKREIAQEEGNEREEGEEKEINKVSANGIKTTGGATGLGFKSKEEREEEANAAKLPPPPCTPGEKVIDNAAIVRVSIPKGCTNLFITAWGAGGGSGYSGTREQGSGDNSRTVRVPGGSGGGGAFVNGYGSIDGMKYDVVVVVGEAGTNAVAPTRKVVNNRTNTFHRNNEENVQYEMVGGNDSTGGGRSGVYLIGKSNQSKSTPPEMALVVAGGGGGGGNYNRTGGDDGEGHKNQAGGEHSGGKGSLEGGKGGASFAKLNQGNIEGGNGPKAGFYYYPERNKAGDPGHDGKVILKYF